MLKNSTYSFPVLVLHRKTPIGEGVKKPDVRKLGEGVDLAEKSFSVKTSNHFYNAANAQK